MLADDMTKKKDLNFAYMTLPFPDKVIKAASPLSLLILVNTFRIFDRLDQL